MCFISYGLALKQPFQRFRIFTLTWERKGSPVSLDVFSNWVETKSEMLIINVCICILFICRCIHTTTSYGMFRKHPLATGRFGLCPTWCTQMFHLVCSCSNGISACIPVDIWEVQRLHQSWQLIVTHWTPMPCLEVLKLRIPSLMIVKAGVPVTRPRRFWDFVDDSAGGCMASESLWTKGMFQWLKTWFCVKSRGLTLSRIEHDGLNLI